MKKLGSMVGLKHAAVLAAALALGRLRQEPDRHGRARRTRRAPASASRAPPFPARMQDFAVNVGDRVFFDSDSTS